MAERDRMLSGALYDASDGTLVAARARAQTLVARYNASSPTPPGQRRSLLTALLGSVGHGVEVVPPFFCDYGSQIHLGDSVFLNTGVVMLDTCRIHLGTGTLVGPAVQFYAATHPTDPDLRRKGLESGAPITVGTNVWIGGGAVVLPGVTIGDDAVVGAGSVVTRNVPPRTVVAGAPARTLRAL